MTVKEAIERLKYDREMCYFNPSTGVVGEPYDDDCKEMAEALDIAIEALESEPVGDCISRQAALDELTRLTKRHKGDTFGGNLLHWTGIKTMIENLPAAQPEQKTATFYVDSEGYERCSACNEHESGMRYFNFCPNCGAKIVQSEAKTAGSVAK